MNEIRVVLDTNLFIATYWNRSAASAKILRACIDGEFTAYYTPEISRELNKILGNIRAKPEFMETVEEYRRNGVEIENVPSAEPKTVDPDDQKFIDCAVAADADYLITSDDHLLSLVSAGRALIMKPSIFWREVGCKHQSLSERQKT